MPAAVFYDNKISPSLQNSHDPWNRINVVTGIENISESGIFKILHYLYITNLQHTEYS